jgi:hypothetical protein
MFLQITTFMLHAIVLDAEGDTTVGGALRLKQQSGTRLILLPASDRRWTWRPTRLP